MSETMTDQEKIAVVHEMIAAWNRVDFQAVADLFTEDGILHSIMLEPKVGRETIRKHLTTLRSAQPGSRIDIDIQHIGVIDGLVFTERLDNLFIEGKAGQVPTIGIMEIKDGKVHHWREFYDLQTMRRETGRE